MKLLLISLAIVVVGCGSAHAQYRYDGPIECLRHADTLSTPDSMRVWRDGCPNSPTYGQVFARGRFRVRFDIYVIPFPSVSEDSVVEVEREAIDPKLMVLRAAFHELEQRAGHFVLRKLYPSVSDTGHVTSRMFTMWFDDYVSIDSISVVYWIGREYPCEMSLYVKENVVTLVCESSRSPAMKQRRGDGWNRGSRSARNVVAGRSRGCTEGEGGGSPEQSILYKNEL